MEKPSKVVFTTDPNSKDYIFNKTPGLVERSEVIDQINSDITLINKSRRKCIMETKTTKVTGSRKESMANKFSDFEKIILYMWSHNKQCQTIDVQKLLFGSISKNVAEKKYSDNRMQDLKWSSHVGKNFNERIFIVQPSGKQGWKILSGYNSSMTELISYCKEHSSNRGRASAFNKTNGQARHYKPRKKVEKQPTYEKHPLQPASVLVDLSNMKPIDLPITINLIVKVNVEVEKS